MSQCVRKLYVLYKWYENVPHEIEVRLKRVVPSSEGSVRRFHLLSHPTGLLTYLIHLSPFPWYRVSPSIKPGVLIEKWPSWVG